MKLVEAIIHNHRSIGSDCVLPLDPNVTTLVGKSESGKTTILEALQRFFDSDPYRPAELCSWIQTADDDAVCSIRFEPDEEERHTLSQLHESIGSPRSLMISKTKAGVHKIIEPHIATTEVASLAPQSAKRIGTLRARARRLIRDTNEFLTQFGDAELDKICASLDKKVNTQKVLYPAVGAGEQSKSLAAAASETRRLAQRATEMIAWTGNHAKTLRRAAVRLSNDIDKFSKAVQFNTKEASSVPAASILELLPKPRFVSDKDIQPITDSVPIGELASEKFSAVLRLLALGGIEPSDLTIEDESDRDRKLHFGAEKASKALTKLWRQEPVEVTFNVSGQRLRLQFISEEGHYGKPSQRSEGFLWFLTFLLNFASDISDKGGLLLLLDEPGIRLHASAQEDLLGLLRTIAEVSQVVYTTHSPFMIDKNFPWRIRAVRKNRRGTENPGTYVDAKPYASASGRAWEPIRSSIGLSGGNSLFVAGSNLVVEGIADQIILAAFSQRLAREGPPPIDLQRIAITPAGGADKVYAVAHLCHSENKATVALLDSDPAGDRAKSRIEKGQVIPPSRVIQVGDIALSGKRKAVELEDLVDARLYHTAAVGAYSKLPSAPKLPESLEQLMETSEPESKSKASRLSSGRVKQTYQELFESNRDEWGDFDNVLVATELANICLGDESPDGLTETLKNFGKLFSIISDGFN